MNAIQTIEQHAENIKAGKAKVHPGQPHRISDAAVTGDGYAQGDLNIVLVDDIPANYQRVDSPSERDKQLVPGNTQGARHCLDSLEGVELFRHGEWGEQYQGLHGPALRLSEERTITHPTHGDITIPAGRCVLTTYQPDFDAETRRERRNAD